MTHHPSSLRRQVQQVRAQLAKANRDLSQLRRWMEAVRSGGVPELAPEVLERMQLILAATEAMERCEAIRPEGVRRLVEWAALAGATVGAVGKDNRGMAEEGR